MLLGIDIGGTSVKAALLDEAGQLIRTSRSQPYAQASTGQLAHAIAQATRQFPPPQRIGLCCPGLLNLATRTVELSVNVPGLVGVRLDDLVAQAIGLAPLPTIALLSDAQAVGYDLFSTRKLTGRLLCLTLGTGVGACVIDGAEALDGRGRATFLTVSGHSPGHIGQFDVSLSDDAPIGPDGGRGSLEAYLGAAALQVAYGQDPAARLTVDDAPIRALVRAIRIAHAIYRPQHVALAGGIGIRLQHLIETIHQRTSEHLTRVARPGWTLFAAEHDHHAACGAARWGQVETLT